MLPSICDIVVILFFSGGKLIFDERDVELHAENILIIDNGLLQVRMCAVIVQCQWEIKVSLCIHKTFTR